MILSDKIIELRKKCGWSQEELAEKLNVSRQAVSKWEGAQSTPDLQRILTMSKLFGVSTDYLIKDEIETAEYVDDAPALDEDAPRRVSMQEAVEFLNVKAEAARKIALGAFMGVLSPIALIVLGAASDSEMCSISESAAGGIGLAALLIIAACAVGIFIYCGMKSDRFEYLDTEPIETEYGVLGLARDRQSKFRPTYVRSIIAAVSVCVLSALPLIITALVTEDALYLALALSATMLMAGAGAAIFIRAGVVWESFQKLMQEGDYTRLRKRGAKLRGSISAAYWLIATAIYLGYSLHTNNWHTSWIIWPVAALIYAAIISVLGAMQKRK